MKQFLKEALGLNLGFNLYLLALIFCLVLGPIGLVFKILAFNFLGALGLLYATFIIGINAQIADTGETRNKINHPVKINIKYILIAIFRVSIALILLIDGIGVNFFGGPKIFIFIGCPEEIAMFPMFILFIVFALSGHYIGIKFPNLARKIVG